MSAAAASRLHRRRLYVDTSAYLCLLLGEEGADELSAEFEDAVLLSSVLLVLEAKRNLVRLAREGVLGPEHYRVCVDQIDRDLTLFELRDLTLDLCASSHMTPVITPRSLELSHLRTALWFHTAAPLDRFVTTDPGQAAAAKELGLPVI